MKSIQSCLQELTSHKHNDLFPMPKGYAESIQHQSTIFAIKAGLEITQPMKIVIEYMPNLAARGKYITDPRGLMMAGCPGTGKTIAAEFLAKYGKLKIVNAIGMNKLFTTGGDLDFFAEAKRLAVFPVVVDDLGAERDALNYGSTSPMAEWLQDRYSLWQSSGLGLHVITNLSKDKIALRYGDRVLDRIQEMCIVRPIKGQSMRISA